MTIGSSPDNQGTSTRPYLLRALHDWCTDNGFTPYIAVHVDDTVQVPMEHVKNSEIVLNVGFEATSGLKLGNEFVEFRARFGGVSRDIVVPVDHVVAIYARENGQGMAFPVPTTEGARGPVAVPPTPATGPAATAPSAARTLRLASGPEEASQGAAVDDGPAGQGSAVEAPKAGGVAEGPADLPPTQPPKGPPSGPRPALKRIK